MSASILVPVVLLFASVVLARPAAANPNKVFAGRIMMSEKRFPSQAKSAAAYTAQIKKQSKTSFQENKEKQSWKIHFVGFLKAPLNDVEYVVKIYELSGRAQQLLSTFEQFTDERGQKTLTSNIDAREEAVRRQQGADDHDGEQGQGARVGPAQDPREGERFTGKVDFSEEEAAGKAE